jgi:hypothetical protein
VAARFQTSALQAIFCPRWQTRSPWRRSGAARTK